MKTLIKKINLLKNIKILVLIWSMLIIFSGINFAQEGKNKSLMHHEVPDDPYIEGSNQGQKTSPGYRKESSLFYMTQVNVNGNGENILGDAANEPSIAVDPTNPNRMVMGWRQFDNVGNNFRQAGYGYSNDGGETWTFPGVINPGVFRSDPVLDFDAEGNFFYNSLTADINNNYWCDVYRIEDGGFEWDQGTFAQGGDKQWMRIDRISDMGAGNNYSFWTSYWSICYPGSFTRSIDGGGSYENCVQITGDPSWGTLAVGSDGVLYIAGVGEYDDFIVAKSTTAQNPGVTVSWDSYSSVNIGGELAGWQAINPAGLLGQAWIDTDVSKGPGNGNVYVMAAVLPYASSDPGDIMFCKSTDGGDIFTAPIRINDDPEGSNNTQWFGTMSVAPNGRIDAVWLDTRDIPGTYMSALYYSCSVDQGETWTPNEKLCDSFDPHVGWPNQEKMGDYFDMVSDDNGAHLAWANTLNGEQDVYYGHIMPQFVGISGLEKQNLSVSSFPNPFSDKTTIRYELKERSEVSLALFDMYGKEIKLFLNKEQQAGIYNFQIEATELSGGIYFCRLNAGGQSETVRLVLIK